MKKYTTIAFGAAAALLCAITEADATAYSVDALTNASDNTPLDRGMILDASTTYSFSVENANTTLWSAGDLPRWSTAGGLTGSLYATGLDQSGEPAGTLIGQDWGLWTEHGFTAPYGALVGEVGTTYFLIGTGADISGLAGDLRLMYWDGYFLDNSGTQTVDVAAVPEPLTLSVFGAGFAGVALLRRRKGNAA